MSATMMDRSVAPLDLPGQPVELPASPPEQGEWPALPRWIHDNRGAELHVRRLDVGDAPSIRELHARCSQQALKFRYFGVSDQLDHLLTWAFDRSLGQTIGVFGPGGLVGMSNLMNADATGTGEVAFLLEDAWQNRGIGSQLVDLTTDIGRADGCRALHADVSLDNGRMRTLFARRGWVGRIEDGDYCMDLALR